jgi:hypothetical protein
MSETAGSLSVSHFEIIAGPKVQVWREHARGPRGFVGSNRRELSDQEENSKDQAPNSKGPTMCAIFLEGR